VGYIKDQHHLLSLDGLFLPLMTTQESLGSFHEGQIGSLMKICNFAYNGANTISHKHQGAESG